MPYAVFDDPQSLNLYNYVRDDPLSRIDPDGHYEVNASGCGGNNQTKRQKKYDKANQRFEQARQKELTIERSEGESSRSRLRQCG